jgi:hypothetical protein
VETAKGYALDNDGGEQDHCGEQPVRHRNIKHGNIGKL